MEANNNITDISLEMDNLYGKVGTPERDAFRKEAYIFCMQQAIEDDRESEKITQDEYHSNGIENTTLQVL
jgi:hypothetical protein